MVLLSRISRSEIGKAIVGRKEGVGGAQMEMSRMACEDGQAGSSTRTSTKLRVALSQTLTYNLVHLTPNLYSLTAPRTHQRVNSPELY